MLCLAVFEPDSKRRDMLRDMAVKWLVRARRDMDIIWFTEAEPKKKIEKYAEDVHIVLISADNPYALSIGTAVRYANPACRIFFYSNSEVDVSSYLPAMPSAYYKLQDGSGPFEVIMDRLLDEVLCSRSFFQFESKNLLLLLPFSNIRYFQSDLKHIVIHMKNGKTYRVVSKLSEIEDRLSPSFIRIHKSFIVNAAYVTALHKDMKAVTLTGSETLPISEAQYNSALNKFRMLENLDVIKQREVE